MMGWVTFVCVRVYVEVGEGVAAHFWVVGGLVGLLIGEEGGVGRVSVLARLDRVFVILMAGYNLDIDAVGMRWVWLGDGASLWMEIWV